MKLRLQYVVLFFAASTLASDSGKSSSIEGPSRSVPWPLFLERRSE